MIGVVPTRLALALALTAALAAACAAAPPPKTPTDTAADADVTIEWRGTWQETYEHNRNRWDGQLEDLDETAFQREFARRLTVLLRGILDRYGKDAAVRREAYQRIARDLGGLIENDGDTVHLEQLVAAFPGDVGLEVAALDQILSRLQGDWRYTENPQSAKVAERAVARLIALDQAGALADDRQPAANAWEMRYRLCLEDGRYWEAALALERRAEITGRDARHHQEKVQLLLTAGRWLDVVEQLEAGDPDLDERFAASLLRNLRRPTEEPPDFPRDLGLEMKWSAVRSRTGGGDTVSIQALLDESAEAEGLMPDDDGRLAAVWTLLDEILAAQKPETLAPLRQTQQRLAEAHVARLAPGDDPQAITATYRRLPWATAVHEAMLASAERMLERGHSGLALRMFEDARSHAADDAVRAKAQVGVWLALVNETGDAATVKAAFEGVAPDAEFPWMGARAAASTIQTRLIEGLSAGLPVAGPALDGLAPKTLRVPGPPPWSLGRFTRLPSRALLAFQSPLGSLQTDGRKVLLAGPNLLACFGDNPARPLWWRTSTANVPAPRRRPQGDREGGQNLAPVPGPMQPAMTGRCVVSRWGTDSANGCLRGVAAFDADTGEMRWSTDDNPAWETMWPVGDPAVADGRAYVLAVQHQIGPILPIHLLCLDADRGTLLWQRVLGSQNPTLTSLDGSPFRGDATIESVRYGNAVTVDRGAVYCSTNLGFIVRCDARDGLVEWASPYRRVGLGRNWLGILRRQGSAPIVVGDRVICLPRDADGLFALDRRTGRRLWDTPLVPAEEAVGVAAGLLVVRGIDCLFGIDPATGEVVWGRRLAGRILGRPVPAADTVYLGTAENLLAVNAKTGEVRAEKPWGQVEPLHGFVVRDGTVVGVSPASASAVQTAAAPPGDAGQTLAMRLKRTWRLERPQPSVWTPPPEADLAGHLLVVSEGVLECLRTGPAPRSVWRRFVPRDVIDVVWVGQTLIVVHDQLLWALDSKTGRPKWRCEVPCHAVTWKVFGPYLAAIGYADERGRDVRLAMVELATGRLLWSHRPPRDLESLELGDIGWDGRHVHCFGRGRSRSWVHAVLRPADGTAVSVAPFSPAGGEDLRGVVAGDAFGFYVTQTYEVYGFPMADLSQARRYEPFEASNRRGRLLLALKGPYFQVQEPQGAGGHHVYRYGDPSYLLKCSQYGEVRGGFWYSHAGKFLAIADLATRQTVTYTVPDAGQDFRFGSIVEFYRLKDRMWVASVHAPQRGGLAPLLQFDTFDASTGSHLETQQADGVFAQLSRFSPFAVAMDEEGVRLRGQTPRLAMDVVWTPEAAYVVDLQGLHAFSGGRPGEAVEVGRTLVPATARRVAIDGSLDEWTAGDAMPLDATADHPGRIYLAHDAERLYLAVASRDRGFVPHVGRGDGAGGDWLELALKTPDWVHRWGVGADGRGRPRWQSLTEFPLPQGVACAVRHDPLGRELVYEIAIPLSEIAGRQDEVRDAGLSVAVWNEEPGGGGAARVATWGSGLAGRFLFAGGHREIHLAPLTAGAAGAMRAIVDETPALPEAFAFFEERALLEARSADGLLDLWADFIARHPESVTVERLLAMDRAARIRGMADPAARLLEHCRAAGVPQAVGQRYAAQAQAYLSQWVNIPDERAYPRSIVMELFDGMSRPDGWGHRLYWGKPYWYGDVPAVLLQDRFPNLEWGELRLPLVLFDMADRPICGMGFMQQGEPPLAWDRTAVVTGGTETVFLDDAVPEGATTSDTWRWIEGTVHSGTKAHAGDDPGQRYRVVSHSVRGFRKPIAVHLQMPTEGPYLSQWVYLDPANPPRAVSLGLFDGRDWRSHAIWGDKTGRGRYIGPLPQPGQWQELRLPLVWTALADEPIHGLYFAHDGGRVLWDKTTLVSGGKTHVLVDDAAPPAPSGKPAQAWAPWADDYIGDARLAPGKHGTALACDGRTACLEVPHSPALEPDTLTIEAWIYLEQWPAGGDTRRWLVNKNRHEETEGHYALMINKTQVGASLNVGGTKVDGFDVWSDEGALALRRWHHVAMTYDGQDLRVYLDGKPVGSVHVGRKRVPGPTTLAVARRQDEYNYYEGRLDEIRLYGRALSAAEIQTRYDAGGKPPAQPDAAQVLWWGFDDAATPLDPAAAWQWVAAPVKSGQRAHTQPPADGWTGHCGLLAEPLLAHLPYDPARALAVLRRHVPALGPTEQAWRMLERLHKLTPRPADRADLYRWFLTAVPDHPRNVDALAALLAAYRDAGRDDALAAVEADIARLKLPAETAYAYRRRCTQPARLFLKSWQVLGPLANPKGEDGKPAPAAEPDAVNLDADCDGIDGKVRWKPYESPGWTVDLAKAVAPKEEVAAQAVCWVQTDAAQTVALEVGHDDAVTVWVNRKLVLDTTAAEPRQITDKASVDLQAGWNEVLVRVTNRVRNWHFWVEVVAPDGSGPPAGVRSSPMPPKAP